MKYGAHIFLWQDRYVDDDLLRVLDSAAALGLSFLEVAVGDDIEFDTSQLAKAADARGLELVLSPGGAWPMECDISLKESAASGLDWHRRAIDLCSAAGAVAYSGAIYGHPGSVRRNLPCRDEQSRIADGLHNIAEYAAANSVKLVLEPMSHFRTHVANTPQQINSLIETAAHDNLYTLLDTYHLVTEVTDLAAAFEEMAPRLWGIHACENNRGAPGTGMIPWERLIASVLAAGWQGYIGFEGYNSTWRGGEFAHERGMFHDVCPDAEQFIGEAMEFLNGLLSERTG